MEEIRKRKFNCENHEEDDQENNKNTQNGNSQEQITNENGKLIPLIFIYFYLYLHF